MKEKLEKHMIRLRRDQWEELNALFPGGTQLSVAAGIRLIIDAYLKRVNSLSKSDPVNLSKDIDL